MGELTRFRMLRNPKEDCGSSPRVSAPGAGRGSELLDMVLEEAAVRDDGYVARLEALLALIDERGGVAGSDATARPAQMIDDLVEWLSCHGTGPPGDLTKWLVANLFRRDFGKVDPKQAFSTVVGAADWDSLLAILEDRLLLAVLRASVEALRSGSRVVAAAPAAEVSGAVARLRVARLVEGLAAGTTPLDGDAIDAWLTCQVILPSPPFPLLPTAETAGPAIVADLYVVRDEWSKYVAGEFAFIENVMPGEERERSTRTTNRTQTVIESETIDVTKTRDETYESERTTEAEETSKQTSLEIGLQFNNDLTVKYGPVENNTQIGASLAFSRTDAQRRASEIARESGRRSIEETEKRIRQLRRVTTETTVRELDAHRLSNTTEDAVRGVYRWVEKIQRYQIFRYPHRLQLEFYLPEPGKFLRELLDVRATTGGGVPLPDALFLTEDGTEKGASVAPDSIMPASYRTVGAALGVTDLPPPPQQELVVTESIAINGGTRDKEKNSWELLPFPPTASGAKEIQLPDGFQAVAWGASAAAAPELAKWRDHTDNSDDGVDEKVGYHSIVAAITVGSTNVLVRNRVTVTVPGPIIIEDTNTVHCGPADYRDRWLAENATWRDGTGKVTTTTASDEALVGKLSFGATLGGAFNGTVSVTLHCVPTDQAMAQWRTDVYGALRGAVVARQREIANLEMANRATTADTVRAAISPTVRASLIRDEFKRQLIDCLLAERFEGFDDAPDAMDGNAVDRPLTSFADARTHGVMVRFFEQSFEWDNLMHVLYPGYWAASDNWHRRVDFASTDLELTAFLESGGARVLVPARPGFEPAVFTFLELGLILDGAAAIGGHGQTSMSVAEEVMSLTRPPADGEAGESWESSVPTAMLWLDTSLTLPIENSAPVLTKP